MSGNRRVHPRKGRLPERSLVKVAVELSLCGACELIQPNLLRVTKHVAAAIRDGPFPFPS